MRVLIVDTCYDVFLASHYGRRPELATAAYDVQWRALMDTFFGTADSYSHHLEPLGHSAHEVVVNCEPLQRAWAAEHGIPFTNPQDVLLHQVDDFGPDVVYVQDLGAPTDVTMDGLHRSGALVAGQIASRAPDNERLRRFDLILTSFPHFVTRFRSLGIASEYLRIAFDARVLDRLTSRTPNHEVAFVGALNRGTHRQGNQLLARAARRLPVEFWGYDLRGWQPWSPLRRRYRGEAWGLAMYEILASSRVVLNRHIGESGEYANNMRLFEATGVGSLLVTDAKTNLGDLFAVGSEVVAYRDVDELVAQVDRYLADEDARREIAAAGQARTLRDHTYEIRMRELAEILEEHR